MSKAASTQIVRGKSYHTRVTKEEDPDKQMRPIPSKGGTQRGSGSLNQGTSGLNFDHIFVSFVS